MNRRSGWKLAVGLVIVAVMAPVSLSAAADVTAERDAYVEKAEPICKTNILANKQIFKGAKGEVKKDELKKASGHFFRAATAFGKTINQLAAIPQPATDTAKLSKWLGLLRKEKGLIEKIGRALAAENKDKASSYLVELNRNSSQANNAVLNFEFNYCRIESSRFG